MCQVWDADAGAGCKCRMKVPDAGVGCRCKMQIVRIPHSVSCAGGRSTIVTHSVSCAGGRSTIVPHNVSSSIFLTSSENH